MLNIYGLASARAAQGTDRPGDRLLRTISDHFGQAQPASKGVWVILGPWEHGTLNREWKYNSKVSEYFIETETTTKLKQKEMEKYREASTSDSRLFFV